MNDNVSTSISFPFIIFSSHHSLSPHNNYNKDVDIIDDNDNDIIDIGKFIGDKGINHNKYDKYRDYESYDLEDIFFTSNK